MIYYRGPLILCMFLMVLFCIHQDLFLIHQCQRLFLENIEKLPVGYLDVTNTRSRRFLMFIYDYAYAAQCQQQKIFLLHPPVFQKNIPESFLCNFTNNDFGNHNFLCKIQMKAGSWKFEILLAYFSKNFHFLFNDSLSLIFLTSCTIQACKQ